MRLHSPCEESFHNAWILEEVEGVFHSTKTSGLDCSTVPVANKAALFGTSEHKDNRGIPKLSKNFMPGISFGPIFLAEFPDFSVEELVCQKLEFSRIFGILLGKFPNQIPSFRKLRLCGQRKSTVGIL